MSHLNAFLERLSLTEINLYFVDPDKSRANCLPIYETKGGQVLTTSTAVKFGFENCETDGKLLIGSHNKFTVTGNILDLWEAIILEILNVIITNVNIFTPEAIIHA